MEYPLIWFTNLSQLAIGASIFLAWKPSADTARNKRGWGVVALFAVAAIICSLFHLGKPLAAVNALANVGGSWLSREVLCMALFCAASLACIVKPDGALPRATAALGLLTLVCQGMTYAPAAMPLLANGLPFFLFLASSLVLGHAVLMARKGGAPELQGNAAQVGRIALVCLTIMLLLAPCMASSGNAAMQASGAAWLQSPAFILSICLLAGGMFLSFATQGKETLTALIMIVGVFMSRAVFFQNTLHTASMIGLPQ